MEVFLEFTGISSKKKKAQFTDSSRFNRHTSPPPSSSAGPAAPTPGSAKGLCPPEPSCHVCRTCPGAAAWLPGPRTAALPNFFFFFLNGLSQSSQHSAHRLQARLLNRRLDLAAPSGKGSSFPFSSVPSLKLFLCPLRSSQLSSSFVRGKGQTKPLAGLKEQSRSDTLLSVVLRSRWGKQEGNPQDTSVHG